MIKIIDSSLRRLTILKLVDSANCIEEINGENKLDFTAVYDEKAAEYIHENNLVELDGDYFDIIYYLKQQNDDGTLTIQVQSEHVSYRLNDPLYNV